MSPTDAEELLAGLEIPGWDSSVQADMISPNWQQKADAVTLIGEKIAVSVCVCERLRVCIYMSCTFDSTYVQLLTCTLECAQFFNSFQRLSCLRQFNSLLLLSFDILSNLPLSSPRYFGHIVHGIASSSSLFSLLLILHVISLSPLYLTLCVYRRWK